MDNYKYEINCTQTKTADIDFTVDNAREITYKTALKYIGIAHILEVFPFYVKDKRQGLTLQNDWHVSYYVSTYQGRKCYIIMHSAIEYIFTKNPTQ